MSRAAPAMPTMLAAAAAALLAQAPAAAQPQAAPPAASIGLLSATFAVTDLDRAVAFYTRGLGLNAPTRIQNAHGVEVPLLFPAGGPTLLLIRNAEPGPASPPRIGRVIVNVPDLRALAARLQAAGYSLAAPIAENPRRHVLVAVAKDPDGNELELVQRPR